MSFGRIVLNLEGRKQLDPKHAMAKRPGRPNKKMKQRMERQELGLGCSALSRMWNEGPFYLIMYAI